MTHAPRRLALFALLAAPVLASGAAGAAGERVTLRWSAPAGCPDANAVKDEVERLLGASRTQPAKPIEVSAAVARDERGRWRVRLETAGDGGPRVRELRGASCKAVADASALILALMIDPEAVATAPASASTTPSPAATPTSLAGAPAPVPTTPSSSAPAGPVADAPAATTAASATSSLAAAAPPPASSTTSAPSLGASAAPPSRALVPPPLAPRPRATSAVSFLAMAWAGADAGTLPGVSASLGLTGVLMTGAQRFELGLAVRPATRATFANRPTAGGDVDLVAGTAGTCRYLLGPPVALGPCVAVEVGRMHARGFGVRASSEGAEPWVAATAGGILMWSPVARLGVVVHLDAAVPLVRHAFVIEGIGTAHEPAIVAGRAAAGLEFAF